LLTRLRVSRFKSILDETVEFPRLTVMFGVNAAGKSNLLEAILALSRLGTERTAADALVDPPIRGLPIEAFAFPEGGLPGLLTSAGASFRLEANLATPSPKAAHEPNKGRSGTGVEQFNYAVELAMQPKSGALSVRDEHLVRLTADGRPTRSPRIEKEGDRIAVRQMGKAGHPCHEPLGQNHTILSDPRFSGSSYPAIERCRSELAGWRVYYLDPRVSMRAAKSPTEVADIGVLGENIAPFLYRLQGQEGATHFRGIVRTLRTIIPSIEDVKVDLDERRGTLDVLIRQNGKDYSSRIISEGTLRLLALCCITVNPWGGSLVGFEEPENGVHPRRIDLIAKLLVSLAMRRGRQVIVTTHSPLFCEFVLRESKERECDVSLLNVAQHEGRTKVGPFPLSGPMYQASEISGALESQSEESLIVSLATRGLVDG